jgi:hypothetical protein
MTACFVDEYAAAGVSAEEPCKPSMEATLIITPLEELSGCPGLFIVGEQLSTGSAALRGVLTWSLDGLAAPFVVTHISDTAMSRGY